MVKTTSGRKKSLKKTYTHTENRLVQAENVQSIPKASKKADARRRRRLRSPTALLPLNC